MKITRRQLRKIILEDLRNYAKAGGDLFGEDPVEKIANQFMIDQMNSGNKGDDSGILSDMKGMTGTYYKDGKAEEMLAAEINALGSDMLGDLISSVNDKINEMEIDPEDLENMSSREEFELRDFMSGELSSLDVFYKKKLDKNIKANKAAKIKKSLPDVDVPYAITNFMVMTGNYDLDAKVNTIFHSESGEELKFAASDLPVVFKDIEIYDFDDKHPRDKSPFIAGYVDESKPQEFYLPRYL